ncbi:MAG: YARHG domain-containing protein [Bacteroidales bacterium]|nr:YARHG domain-containing protein [Bacteroidales bacterium]
MNKILTIIALCALSLVSWANDGVFYAQGNQLIPIVETDIRVTKEVLTLKRVGGTIEVSVYYEFFNPKGEKDLLVGFEAAPSYPVEPTYPNHPNIFDFTVQMNGAELPYQMSVVPYFNADTARGARPYLLNGRVEGMAKDALDTLVDWDWAPICYVYHFNAHFKQGLNVVRHTYRYRASNSVVTRYECPYVLTAANRWANHQIDDFTLDIDMGDRQSLLLMRSFFRELSQWKIEGAGRANLAPDFIGFDDDSLAFFHIRQGSLHLHATDFHPEGELWLCSPLTCLSMLMNQCNSTGELLDAMRRQYVEASLNGCWGDEVLSEKELTDYLVGIELVFSDMDKKIIKNLPFAQRGYIFRNKALQRYFESTDWYVPDPDYQADMDGLRPVEKQWVEYWSK